MYTLTRISTEPNTTLKILVDQPDPDSQDAGLMGGGLFLFAPAGQEGSEHKANAHAARVIMGDYGLAPHFRCTPALPGATTPAVEGPAASAGPAVEHQDAPAEAGAGEAPARARDGGRAGRVQR